MDSSGILLKLSLCISLIPGLQTLDGQLCPFLGEMLAYLPILGFLVSLQRLSRQGNREPESTRTPGGPGDCDHYQRDVKLKREIIFGSEDASFSCSQNKERSMFPSQNENPQTT